MPPTKNKRKSKEDILKKQPKQAVTREFTIHIHKYIHGIQFKKRAPRAIKAIRKFATKMMGTKEVKVTPSVNQYIWSKGIRNVPYRIRVRLHRKVNEDEDAPEKFFTEVTYIPVKSFKGLQTQTINN
ncbi:60S ribosomal protein L31 [Anaeramoeba ignava]|uniref:60S ribosomal protein L31 n=1 Tax=Anaeramoeba ignava TaxID=1746090 RepID=A0A9Q0RIE8_ANAIG|nr:60S ribosomal protein L31 [Anaeramoeba ignava]